MTNPIPPGAASAGAAAVVGGLREVKGLIPGADAASAVTDGVTAVRRWVSDRHNWTRVAWFGAGVTLMMIGAGMIGRPVAQKAVRAAATAVPTGKIATAVKGATT